MQDPKNLTIVLLGKSGSGKSSLANTLLGETIFKQAPKSKVRRAEAYTKSTNGLNLTIVDTPGFFTIQTESSEWEQQCQLLSCLTQCAPGPHAFLLVLTVDRFTKQEQAAVDQIKSLFGEGVFRFTTVIFTHGDQLPQGTSISDFVQLSKGLTELVRACGGRCHVVDNKYWNEAPENTDRSNEVQVKEIIDSVVKTASANQSCYTSEELVRVERDIQAEQKRIHDLTGLSLEKSRELAKTNVLMKDIELKMFVRGYARVAVIAGIGVAVAIGSVAFMAPKVIKFIRQKFSLHPGPCSDLRLPIPPQNLQANSTASTAVVEPATTVMSMLRFFLRNLLQRTYPPHDSYNPFE